MNHYEKAINAEPSEEEKWKELVKEIAHSGYLVLSKFGTIDTTEDAMKDVVGGENLTYEEYMQALFNSQNIRRSSFEHCYYSDAVCFFKGQISRFDKKRGKVIFKRIYISALLTGGDGYEGKEDHVWMDIEPFKNYQVGDCLCFGGDIYRYLKKKNGKQISFGIREPSDITQIEPYELPSDDYMLMQDIDQMICAVCMFNKHCYMGMCIANQEWRDEMRKTLFDAAKGNA